jgi:carboxypeptidase Q
MKLLLFLLVSIFSLPAHSQENQIRAIFDMALTDGKSYEMLDFLSNNIGGRLSGSPEAAAAVEYTRQKMIEFGFDTVFLQPVMVPHWIRGEKEIGRIISATTGSIDVNVCALGNSIGTGLGGISSGIVEVTSFEQLEKLGKEKIEGKIVFFNRPMDPKLIRTFSAYGGAVGQRGGGASQAAKYGAIGVVVRSMTLSQDDTPHTGAMNYTEGIAKIPAIAISTNDANLLSKILKKDKESQFYFETHSKMLPDILSYNVVGEIRGTTFPEEYIVVGGHLDSWDLGDGSHDDGAGCVQSIEVLRLFKKLGIAPRHTLRAVMFMDEENGLSGGLKYAELASKNNEKHIAAMESDRGGFTPRGFTISGNYEIISTWSELFEPYGITQFLKGGGGADIGPLRAQGTTLIGFYPDPQRYFDYHHAASDTFDKVNKRELELGAAAMTSLIYLIDQNGL